MSTAAPTYFWNRAPSWLVRLALGSLLAATALAAFVASLAMTAQHGADRVASSEHYSVSMHVVAMLAVGGLAVTTAAMLLRQGLPLLGAVVVIATAVGPMTLIAVPVSVVLVDQSTWADTKLWWHGVVAVVTATLLAASTWWATRCLNERRSADPLSQRSRLVAAVIFATVTAVAYASYLYVPAQANVPVLRAMIAWAVLAGALSTTCALSRTLWPTLVLLLGAAATLGLVFLAYSRIGGWPGVAGWELNGMQSPIITSVASSAALLLAPLVGAAVWLVRQGLARHHSLGTQRSAEAVAASH